MPARASGAIETHAWRDGPTVAIRARAPAYGQRYRIEPRGLERRAGTPSSSTASSSRPSAAPVLYNDGVTDARGAHGHFGAARLAAVLAMLVGLPPAQVVDRIDRAVGAYRVGDPTDDSAIVAFRCPDNA